MCSNVEELKNIILFVVERKELVNFGGEEHLKLIETFEQLDNINDIMNLKNELVKKAIKTIYDTPDLLKKLNKILEDTK